MSLNFYRIAWDLSAHFVCSQPEAQYARFHIKKKRRSDNHHPCLHVCLQFKETADLRCGSNLCLQTKISKYKFPRFFTQSTQVFRGHVDLQELYRVNDVMVRLELNTTVIAKIGLFTYSGCEVSKYCFFISCNVYYDQLVYFEMFY